MTESGKWDDNRYSFPSVTLLWELFSGEGKMGVSCLLRSITSAFHGLGRPSSSSLTMGTRQKAESLAPELRAPAGAKIPVPARRSSPRRAPVRGRI